MKQIRLVVTLWLSLLLVGCQPIFESAQPNQSDQIILTNGTSLGQTFVAHFNGLAAVGLQIRPDASAVGVLELTLKESLDEAVPLRQVELPLSKITHPGSSYFYFQPVDGSNQTSYYFSFTYHGAGSVKVASARGDTNLNGAAYRDQAPVDSQIAFELVYGRRLLLVGLTHEFISWIGWTLAAILLFIVPGWGLLCWLHPRWAVLSFWEKLSFAGGLSLCIFPLLMLWANLIGLQLGTLNAWLPILFGFIAIIFRNWKSIRQPRLPTISALKPNWPGITLTIGFGLLLAIRYWVIRSLDLPLWGDSLQHTMISQLLVDHGGLFQNWQPYADLLSFTYHFGFHSLAAALHWVTGTSLPESVLWSGQLVNALAVMALYPLTLRLTGSHWAGTATVILAGSVFAMPMFYLNWGRYTQLAGLAILAVAVTFLMETVESQKPTWSLNSLTWIAWAGLALTHYRVLIFGVLFILAYLLINIFRNSLLQLIGKSVLCLTGAFILVSPWVLRVLASESWNPFFHQISIPANQLSEYSRLSNSIGDLTFYLPAWTWIILPIVIGIGLWKRQADFALVSLWWFFVLLAANPQWLGLPGTGLLTSFAVMISAFFPVSILLGSSFGLLAVSLTANPPLNHLISKSKDSLQSQLIPVSLSIFLVTMALISSLERVHDLSSKYSLATRPDLHAAKWIQENLPPEAHFLVNSTFAYGGTALVGTDGGWWLPLLAKRQTNQPPLPYLAEVGPRQDYVEWINSLADRIKQDGLNHPEVLQELKKRQIEYIYIGQRQGMVNSTEPLIKLEPLKQSQNFQLLYHQDRVWIFRMVE